MDFISKVVTCLGLLCKTLIFLNQSGNYVTLTDVQYR